MAMLPTKFIVSSIRYAQCGPHTVFRKMLCGPQGSQNSMNAPTEPCIRQVENMQSVYVGELVWRCVYLC